MTRKNLAIVIVAMLLSSSLITGCSKRKETHLNDLLTNIIISKFSTSDKEINRIYIKLITPHLECIGTDWRTFRKTCKKGGKEISYYDNALTITTSLEDIKDKWKSILAIDTEETKEIKELKEQLDIYRNLHIDAIENFLNGFTESDPVLIKKGMDFLNKSAEMFYTTIKPMTEKLGK